MKKQLFRFLIRALCVLHLMLAACAIFLLLLVWFMKVSAWVPVGVCAYVALWIWTRGKFEDLWDLAFHGIIPHTCNFTGEVVVLNGTLFISCREKTCRQVQLHPKEIELIHAQHKMKYLERKMIQAIQRNVNEVKERLQAFTDATRIK